MLLLLDTNVQTQKLRFDPRHEDAQRAIRGARWKSTTPEDQADLTTLWRTIATKLKRGGFVFFHVDGDVRWSAYRSSENARKFDDIVRVRVGRVLQHGPPEAAPHMVDELLTRLFAVIPCYAMESWLYQNTAVAIELCQGRYKGRDVARFEAWRVIRAALDGVEKPKAVVCLGSTHNHELAKSHFPYGEVYDAGASYAAVVNRLLSCAPLLEALRSTWALDPG